MAATTPRLGGPLVGPATQSLRGLATAAILALCGLGIAVQVESPSPLFILGTALIGALVAWMVVSERYELSLALLMLYLGLADGYLKLRTGNPHITLVRDLLLYSIVAGALLRMAVRGERLRLPPLGGWVLAWTAVVLVQLANPNNGTLLHSVAALRQHVAWVPLFFFGYALIRSKASLRGFFAILLVVAAANGVVGLIQLNMTPDELAGWGPGYAKAIKGEAGAGSVSPRGFTNDSGEQLNRPFGLGGDSGFGGVLGMLAVPAALALLVAPGGVRTRLAVALLGAGAVMAVATSASRTVILGTIFTLIAFAVLSVTSRGGKKVVFGLAVASLVAYAVVGFLSSSTGRGAFDRYQSIENPSLAVSTAYDYRSGTLAKVPEFMTEIPFGGGIGTSGPAGSFGGGNGIKRNGESEANFLMIETGIPGLVVMYGFMLTLLGLSLTRIRRLADGETRLLLTAVAAPLFGIFIAGFAGISSANSPPAPYLWFAAGILAFWLTGERLRSGVGSTAGVRDA